MFDARTCISLQVTPRYDEIVVSSRRMSPEQFFQNAAHDGTVFRGEHIYIMMDEQDVVRFYLPDYSFASDIALLGDKKTGHEFIETIFREGIDEEDLGDTSSFEKPSPRSSRAAHPEAMDVIKDICEKLECKPKFINSGARGYQVRLGGVDWDEIDSAVADLKAELTTIGYPNIQVKRVGSQYGTYAQLAFIVPYESKLFEAATITPEFNKAARAAYEQLAMGKPMNSVSMWLQDKYHFDQKQIDLIFHYMSMMQPKRVAEGTMPGPSDQGGASTPPPHQGPSDSISAPAPDMGSDKPAPGTDTAKPQQGEAPDPKQMIQQNPELADFFAAMAKMKPEEIQNITQMFTESLDDDESESVEEAIQKAAVKVANIMERYDAFEERFGTGGW